MGSNTDMNEEVKDEKSDKDIVKEYWISLVIGIILLSVLWTGVVILTSGLPQFYKSVIGIGALIFWLSIFGIQIVRDMPVENKIKLIGSIIILTLAIFWAAILSVHPNLLFRIFMFSMGFGTTASGLTLPLIWLSRSIDIQNSGRSAE